MEPVYYSKIEYAEYLGYGNIHSIMVIDLENKELSYQEFEWKRIHNYEFGFPVKKMCNWKTDFKSKIIQSDYWEQEVIFSYGKKLTDEQMEKLLPYCNALDFEPFRGRKMSMSDEGYIGYRDEITMQFTAITNSYIPKLELSMNYYYDEEHIWPSEKLYRYLVRTFFENKKYKGYGPVYGAYSLF